MTRVGIYCRISEDREGRALGVERQLEDCERRAAREGWTVVEVFVDNDISASTRSKKMRVQYKRMITAARRGAFEVILSYSNSRLTRRPRELEDLIQLHEQTGVRVCTIVSGDDDLSTPSGRFTARVKASADASVVEGNAENLIREVKQRAEQGRNHGGQRPFGWGQILGYRADAKPILDVSKPRPGEFEALREGIFSVTKGASIRSIAKAWDAAGLLTTGGKLWTPTLTSVRQTLTRWRNAGVRVYRGEPLFDAPLVCTPVVTRAELEALLDHLSDRTRRHNRGRVAQTALLGSLGRCGNCGNPLRSATRETSKNNPIRLAVYRCDPRGCVTVRRSQLDDVVVEVVLAELLSADLTVLADSPEDRTRLVWLRAELSALDGREQELASMLGAGELSRAEWKAAVGALHTKKSQAEDALHEITERFAPAEFVSRERDLLELTDEESDAEATTVLDRFDSLELHRRREIIRGLVSITVNPGRGDDRVIIDAKASNTRTRISWHDFVGLGES